MKFFTPDWHSGDLPDSESDTIVARYWAHLAGLALPPGQHQLANDVHLHDALMEEVRDDVEPGTITNEIQKGYMMGDDVLRHAKVIVAKRGNDS